MTTPRRQLIRPAPAPTPTRSEAQRRLQRLRDRQGRERAALDRWMKRLRRAFRAVEKTQHCVARLERQIARTEE